ncbi:MAG TPA: hypothetical protein VIM30_08475, partial [Candidatus Limnocylindrales bacterium]
MMFGYGSDPSFAPLWLLGGTALIGLIAGLVLLALDTSGTDEAQAILAGRLARGEIGPDQYARTRKTLARPSRGRGPARIGG